MNHRLRKAIPAFLAAMLAGSALAATPPARIHYQGVLRDATDAVLDGDHDMVFRFWNAETAGDEILIDTHDAAHANPVSVVGGMFGVELGGGALADGTGPGTYASVTEVFRDYGTVWLEIRVGGETLSPRVRVNSAAYALNADTVDGRQASEFLDTTASTQTKHGTLFLDVAGASYGLESYGGSGGAFFMDNNDTGRAYVARSNTGIRASGSDAGGYFEDTGGTSHADVAYGGYGIRAYGNTAGGYFESPGDNAHADVAFGATGIRAVGAEMGGEFESTSGGALTRIAHIDLGISATGTWAGGYFHDSDHTATAYAAYEGYGIDAEGDTAGGHFSDPNGSGEAYVAYGNVGIRALGSGTGGTFVNVDSTGQARLAWGDVGIQAEGAVLGGLFESVLDSAFARAADIDTGIVAGGDVAGGHFTDTNNSGEVWVAYGNNGVDARGSNSGVYASNTVSSGAAYLALGHEGIYARGDTNGGRFGDSNGSGFARVAYGDRGIWAKGTFAGGTFSHPDDVTFWADVARNDGYKIRGTGAVSFQQNHPYDPAKAIVYAAPEGDEVAVYTRGSGRLVAGEARIPLGETFQWVANPDIGLTAHLTPQGECNGLYVASKSTEEIVVRELGGGTSEAAFDYIVYGLRLGFEELAVVRDKDRDAFPPAADVIEAAYVEHPELRPYNALERYKAMRVAAGESGEVELAGSQVLLAALDGQREEALARAAEEAALEAALEPRDTEEPDRPVAIELDGESLQGVRAAPTSSAIPVDAEGNVYGRSFRPSATDFATLVDVSEPVEPGDVLVIDALHAGTTGLARNAGDPGVFGIVAAEPGVVLGQTGQPGAAVNGHGADARVADAEDVIVAAGAAQASVPVAVGGVVLCKVDAGYGSIRPRDLLMTSPTPGHAMRVDDPAPGTVLGKALEPLDAGTGTIRVLVMLR